VVQRRTEVASVTVAPEERIGADDGTRTRDLQLGKLTCYQLHYIRPPRAMSGALSATATGPVCVG
jgi:hypothetical protein